MTVTLTTDEVLLRAVRAELSRSPEVADERITASVFAGVVSLRGTVRDRSEREAAIRAAKRVQGVDQVNDRMRHAVRAITAADAEILEDAQGRLSAIAGATPELHVNVHDRQIFVAGDMPDNLERAAIITALAATPGARTVTEKIRTVPARGHMTDAALQSAVVNELDHHASTICAHIGVATTYGVVQLSGVVRSQAEWEMVRHLVLQVPGVTAIADNISIEDGAYTKSDLALASEIRAVLLGNEKIRSLPIRAEVTGAIATLWGTVPSTVDRDLVIDVVKNLTGIVEVNDHVTISP